MDRSGFHPIGDVEDQIQIVNHQGAQYVCIDVFSQRDISIKFPHDQILVLDRGQKGLNHRIKPLHMSHLNVDSIFFSQITQGSGFVGRMGEGFFHEHMASVPDRFRCHRVVGGGGHTDDDGFSPLHQVPQIACRRYPVFSR